jgi:streptogramin lyase
MVTADALDGRRITVYADGRGAWRFPDDAVSDGVRGRARLPGLGTFEGTLHAGTDIRLAADTVRAPGSGWLAELPAGEERRRFILDCTGCHVTDGSRAEIEGRRRDETEWAAAVALMRGQFGPGTGFPIISSWAAPETLSPWLAEHFGDADPRTPLVRGPDGDASGAVLTEYPVPVPADLPHDLMVDADGVVWITGMFTHVMYRLDAESGVFETEALPVPGANPRALDIDADGRVWVVLGGPGHVAVREPASATWTAHDVGMYAHSIAVGPDGRGWVNGHFTVAPELVAALDADSGALERFEVPPESGVAEEESTIPYGLRVADDGIVWGTQLRGNRLLRLDPADGRVRQWRLPITHSGPRRPDVAPDGTVWIPLYAANALARFDPAAERFTLYDFPVDGALPYVVRYDRGRDLVWIGTGHGDVVASFDPETGRFTLYPLPTRGALVRHLDVDEARGDVWFAYGASPGIPGAVLRLQPAGP